MSGEREPEEVAGDLLSPLPDDATRASADHGSFRWRGPLLVFGPLILLAGALYFYLHGGRYEVTDDAALQSGLVSVSPNIEGRVIAVEVRNNQRVRKGDILFRLDPAPFQTAVDEASAQLADARSTIGALRANFAQGASEIAAARQRLLFAEREAARQKDLVAEGISSQAQYDQALLAARTAQNEVETTRQQNRSIQEKLSGSVDAPAASQPTVRRAQAAFDRASLQLGYTVVRAPQDGIIARADQLQVGDWVTPARPVFSIVGTRLWIEANFKENQLRYMRIGQPATIHIDAFPDLDLRARVTSFSPGTGSSFSVLPAENATGNWVKVVQRLPVELTLDGIPSNVPLHAGLSAEVTVDTRHKRRLFGLSAQSK